MVFIIRLEGSRCSLTRVRVCVRVITAAGMASSVHGALSECAAACGVFRRRLQCSGSPQRRTGAAAERTALGRRAALVPRQDQDGHTAAAPTEPKPAHTGTERERRKERA